MTPYEIPLTGTPQTFRVTLGTTGVTLTLSLTWRNLGGAGWVMDIADANGVPLVSGIPLVTGADLLAQYQHLGIPGSLWVVTVDGQPDDVPTWTNLGTGSKLIYAQP